MTAPNGAADVGPEIQDHQRHWRESREAFSQLDCLDAECPYYINDLGVLGALDTVRRPLRSAVLTILEFQRP